METSNNRTLRTCKRGIVAIRRDSTVATANSNLFYIAFGGLPCVDDKNIVYGEIIDGYVYSCFYLFCFENKHKQFKNHSPQQ